MELATARLLLRDLLPTDRAAVRALADDADVMRYIDWAPHSPDDPDGFLAAAAAAAAAAAPRTRYALAAADRPGGAFVGYVELAVTSAEHRRAEIGYALARPHWGRGYATEAAAALLGYAFTALGLRKVTATCDPANAASRRILEAVGMQREGYLRDHCLLHGEWRDRLLYAALAPTPDPAP
ncbi:N-acetyltransferase [Pilimelia anulata]|uniref:N-acetyltransferase n=1 Tax=Pilimelia anulata TaxID=53371 RepID=A0A8J3FCF8_9ACTN|nr:GNAT family protein [Pilimelia anulata]GGK08233.1 N-acetyltransferase [Pilimelia anulata]